MKPYPNMFFRVHRCAALVVAPALLCAACGGSGSPPSSSSLSPAAILGEKLFFDTALSASGRQSCGTCHAPAAAFADSDGLAVPLGGPNMDLPGFRNTPSLTYASFTPAFHFESDGTPVGGFMRDGREASLASQAQGPFLKPFEMANATAAEVVARLKTRPYLDEFTALYGTTVLDDPSGALQRIGLAIAAFETEDGDFHPFSSKYDRWVAGRTQLTALELQGLTLFNDPTKGNCAACHVDTPAADGTPALFTDFTYDNLGVPRNTAIAANDDATALPYVPQNSTDGVHHYYDLGLCGPLREAPPGRDDLCGAFKVPTLRNVAVTAPYFHNGAFANLQDVVSFYVTRDTAPDRWYAADASGIVKFDDMPAIYGGQFIVDIDVPGSDSGYRGNVNVTEVPYNRHIGEAPALSTDEINAVVAFLCTLTDGYDPDHPETYTLPAQCPQTAASNN
jgi:cytochrome c peroxidase